jgi:two-component system nitrate/nitrite response regulator NarL
LDTIAVCDTEPIAIEGLRSLLEPLSGLCVVAAETSLSDGLDSLRELRPSMFVLDAAFGVHAVKDALRAARDSGSASIVWGSLISESESIRLIQTGASAVIRKNCSLNSLVDCFRSVASGGTWMDRTMFPEMGYGLHPGHSPLTSREQEVMDLVERGMKNREIAEALGIRTGTVKIHLKHIFEKTGVRGRYGLALSALREKGLISEVV